jgi:amidase
MRRHYFPALTVLALALAAVTITQGVTRLPSADGQYWDIQDTSPWSQDSGGIATGGRANPFNGFGYLKLQVRRADRSVLVTNQYLRGFGLARDGERFDSITPVLSAGIVVSRSLFAPKETNYLRYVDSFSNSTSEDRIVDVAWGGAAGAYEEGGLAAVAATASGDRRIDAADGFVTVMQNANHVEDPMKGPSGHGPSAHVLGAKTTGILTRAGDMYGDPFKDAYPGFDPAHIAYVFSLTIKPGQTVALMTFVVKGLSEVYDPRGSAPTSIKDALVAMRFGNVYKGADAKIPSPGQQITAVTDIARTLLRAPDLRGLTERQRSQIRNWSLPAAAASTFSVFEQTVSQLQEALTKRETTSEDIVRDYLTRLTLFDRNGPTFHSMLALNPNALAAARALDAERAAGKIRSPFHGIPIVFKDNIDALDLPTTAGSRALLERQPRLDSRMAAGMRRGGAIVLGKANLDEFPFGDFGISTVAGTIGNAYDPSLSTSGSSGGSAVAVSTSLAALGFGTDTCNSLSNPSSFASLATIRTTRGLTSRAGVVPLNPYNDAVGPMAKSVKDVALALDLVAGSDAEDPVTSDADTHIKGSFAEGLNAGALKGARIGLLRQRFVGFTGEREIAVMMDRVAKELSQAGATVVEVTVPNLDAEYDIVRQNPLPSPVLKQAWTAYLSRGSTPGDKVITVEDLVASGKLAPGSVGNLRRMLNAAPDAAALAQAGQKFTAARDGFRKLFVDLMDRGKLDALLYPGNQARPHTHEGGLERYGSEPGTCQESAVTGLPQVTVPGGFIGGRYPFGVSFLGRMWDDQKLLNLGYAYEQATHHRKPPATVTR